MSLAAVPVPTIRSRWQISLICSTSERVRRAVRCPSGSLQRMEGKRRQSSRRLLEESMRSFRASMCRLYIDVSYNEDGTIASHDPPLSREGIPEKVKKQLVMDVTDFQLPGETGGSVYQGNPGPRGTGDPERLYPRLSFLPGRYAVPSHQRAGSGDAEKSTPMPC